MAKAETETPAAASAPEAERWETLPSGSLGDEHDFERDGATFVGTFIGTRTVETDKVESGQATAIQFAADPTDPSAITFIWASADLDVFTDPEKSGMVRPGDVVKITFRGRVQLGAGPDGKPRQVKRYSVQVRRA